MRPKAQRSHDCGLLPLPKGEGWGEGFVTLDRSEPPHPHPLPSRSRIFPTSAISISDRTRVNPSSTGERESRRAAVKVRTFHTRWVTLAAAFLFSLPSAALAQSSVESFYKDQRVR